MFLKTLKTLSARTCFTELQTTKRYKIQYTEQPASLLPSCSCRGCSLQLLVPLAVSHSLAYWKWRLRGRRENTRVINKRPLMNFDRFVQRHVIALPFSFRVHNITVIHLYTHFVSLTWSNILCPDAFGFMGKHIKSVYLHIYMLQK